MAFNGSGTFALYSPGNPVVTGTTISSTWANNTLSDIATGLSTCITKNGQTTTTATIPFAGAITIAGTSGFILNEATSTAAKYIHIANTSGSAYFGVESSAGAVIVTGSAAYSTSIAGSVLNLSGNNGANIHLKIATDGVHTMSAYGAGTATFSAAGVISSVSDETYKIKDGTIADPIPMLMALEPGYYFGKSEANMGEGRQLGFYAQNVRNAIGPEAAPDPEEGRPWGYFDRSVLAVAVLAAQEHARELAALKMEIAELREKYEGSVK